MSKERIEGQARDVLGQAQESYGDFIDDDEQRLKGKLRQKAGQAQASYGEAIDNVREFTVSNPFGALATAAAIGFVIGRIWRL
ncbi:CsbD family protein [Halotalea alkalilenta]|uniref:CsbD-like domain-containing protein n=1 Tax=Halotalea alkalilenta TaxID=376489 RepID=A0A172YBP3_9GAMM|nr:CsbD family protein [Halotalea alkalilenta]ANF56532.1 hypothetical protein A5892_02810 [Halotalea alkalilenta]